MPSITLDERQKINHKLKVAGFGGLNDPNLFQQIATLYRTHESFRGLLMSTAPDERRIAYESLRPHLMFTAKPLDVYEREIHEKAEREQWDVWNPETQFPEAFQVGHVESEGYRLERLAQEAIAQQKHESAKGVLDLVCTKCTKLARFPATTRKEATKKAHDIGWRWDERNGTKRTYCPEHVPGRATMVLECSKCPRIDRMRVWDENDGYRAARLAGWTIDDESTCPKCSVKLVTIQ